MVMETLATATSVSVPIPVSSTPSQSQPRSSAGSVWSLQDLRDEKCTRTPSSKKWKRKLCCLTACRKVVLPSHLKISYFKVRPEWYKTIREARQEPLWIPQTADVRLCSLHFTSDQFKILDKIYVKDKVLPTHYLTCDQVEEEPLTPPQILVASAASANIKPINPKYIDMSLVPHSSSNNNSKSNSNAHANMIKFDHNDKNNINVVNNGKNPQVTRIIVPRIKVTPQQKKITLVKSQMMSLSSSNGQSSNEKFIRLKRNDDDDNNSCNNMLSNSSMSMTTNLTMTDPLLASEPQQQQQMHFLHDHQLVQHQHPQDQDQPPQQLFILDNDSEIEMDSQSFNNLMVENDPLTSSSHLLNPISTEPSSTMTTMVAEPNLNNIRNISGSSSANDRADALVNSGECREISANSIVLVNLKRPNISSKNRNSMTNPNFSTIRRVGYNNCAQSFSKIAASFRASKMNGDPSSSQNSTNNNFNPAFGKAKAKLKAKTTTASPSRKIEKLQQANAALRTKVYQKTRQISRLDKRIASFKKHSRELEEQLSLDEIEIAAVSALKENPIMKIIIETEMQKQRLKKACTKGMRYSDEMKRLAVTIFKLSLPVYKYLRKAFALPEESSVREWISGQDVTVTNIQNVIHELPLLRKAKLVQLGQGEGSRQGQDDGSQNQNLGQHHDLQDLSQDNDHGHSHTHMIQEVGGIVVHHEFEIQHNTVDDDDDGGHHHVVVMEDDDDHVVHVHDYAQHGNIISAENLEQLTQQVEMEVGTTVSVTDMSELLLLSQ